MHWSINNTQQLNLYITDDNVTLEIFTVVNNLLLKETVKIKDSKILFQRIFARANCYDLLKPQTIDYSKIKRMKIRKSKISGITV